VISYIAEMKNHIFLNILDIIEETEDCKTFVFDAPDLVYTSGQFLTFILTVGQHTIRRAYSFSSSFGVDSYPSVTVKRIENGEGSRYILNTWKKGDTVEAIHPVGKFILPDSIPSEIVLFAAGSGIVPIFSILKSALRHNHIEKIHLFYSNKSTNTTIFLMQLTALEKQHPSKLSISWFFSNNVSILKARVNAEFIENYFSGKLKSPVKNIHVYTCGPENFMYLTEVTCKYLGIQHPNFHQELFYRAESESQPSHAFKEETFDVHFNLASGNYKIKVNGNQSILSQAIKQDVPVLWSCAAGTCSTCSMKLSSGEVYLSRNEVLTDQEINRGITLTCTAYPEKGPIVLTELSNKV
jgi:ring-1,2-phenylacetyl-CoA epoxidase subunit PaaE